MRVKHEIKRIAKEGITDRTQIAALLNERGFTKSDGSPLTRVTVQGLVKNIRGMRLRRRYKNATTQDIETMPMQSRQHSTVATAKQPSKTDRDALFELVLDSRLEDAEKVRILCLLKGGG